jgi:hypothetical protein
MFDGAEFGAVDDPAGCLVAVVVIIFLPVILLVLTFTVEWLALLAVLPLAMVVRAIAGKPWIVVARPVGEPQRVVYGSRPVRYAYAVRGWRASREAIRSARSEIVRSGAPESLGVGAPLSSRR